MAKGVVRNRNLSNATSRDQTAAIGRGLSGRASAVARRVQRARADRGATGRRANNVGSRRRRG